VDHVICAHSCLQKRGKTEVVFSPPAEECGEEGVRRGRKRIQTGEGGEAKKPY
jgi:hypothetical protein